MDFETSSHMAPLATSSPRKITDRQSWIAVSKKRLLERFEAIEKKFDMFEKKINEFKVLDDIKFCDIYAKEDASIRSIIDRHVVKREIDASPGCESLDNSDTHGDNTPISIAGTSQDTSSPQQVSSSPFAKKLRPPERFEPIFSQGGTPLFVPVGRQDLPQIHLPMTDGRIFNLVVKQEPLSVPELDAEETRRLIDLRNFVDKILTFNN